MITQEFMLQWAYACPGYKRFFLAWCRHNSPETCPTEYEWERWNDKEPKIESLSLSKLLDIFPEAIKTAKTKLTELKEIEPQCNEELNRLLAIANTTDPDLLELINEVAFAPMEAIPHWEKIVKMDEFKRKPAGDGTITDKDILRAKEFPIASIEKPNRAGFIKCPFHNEKTASCKVFKDNRFHCFGCGADGDVIDFIMKQNNLTFIEAVKKILCH